MTDEKLDYRDDIDDILDEVDFERIKSVMEFLDWHWADIGIPSTKELRKAARRLLRSAAEGALRRNGDFYVASGGFFARADVIDEKVYMRIHFEIQDSDNYD